MRVREGLARRGMSRQQLADAARISLSTLEKALSGQRPFTLPTLVRLEAVLGLPLRGAGAAGATAQASKELGAYRREGVDWLVGTYLTLRPSFERADAVYAYLTEIAWDDGANHLVFKENARLDAAFAQRGVVSMPYQSGHIYLVTNENGQFRLATLNRPSIAGHMFGLLSTLRADRGGRLTPTATAIALLREANVAQATLGQIVKGQPAFEAYRAALDRICDEEFGVLLR